MSNYESAQRQLPSNWGKVTTIGTPEMSDSSGNTLGQSWLALILPNLDEMPLYQSIKLNDKLSFTASANGIVQYNNPVAAQTVVKTFLCPADTQQGFLGNQILCATKCAITNYKAVNGCNWPVNVDSSGKLSPDTALSADTNLRNLMNVGTSVVWPRGRNAKNPDGIDHGNGIICRGGTTGTTQTPTITVMADVRDGLSKTFAVGETVAEFNPWSSWFWFDGSTATCGIPLNFKSAATSLGGDPRSSWQYTYAFRSRHSGGANFSMCDGSATFINEMIDLTVYRSLATIDGFENVSVP
jgi:prepilin-type processing-associated H-X9-DG protein